MRAPEPSQHESFAYMLDLRGCPGCSLAYRLLQLAGYSTSVVDEYFYQDEWQGPSRLSDRILLFLGDPLEQVDVPFTPTTLVQNYTLN